MRVAIKELSGILLVQTQSCGLEKGGMHTSREAEGAEGWGKAMRWQTGTSLLQRPRNPTQGDKGIKDIYKGRLSGIPLVFVFNAQRPRAGSPVSAMSFILKRPHAALRLAGGRGSTRQGHGEEFVFCTALRFRAVTVVGA